MNFGQSQEIAGGAIECIGYGTTFLDANSITQEQIKYKFFDASGEYVPEDKVFSKLGMFTNDIEFVSNLHNRPFPNVKFGFHYNNMDAVLFHSRNISANSREN